MGIISPIEFSYTHERLSKKEVCNKKAAIWRNVLILEDRRLKIFCEHGNLPIRSFPNGVKNYLKIQDLLVSIVLLPLFCMKSLAAFIECFGKQPWKKRPANILCFMNPNAPFSMLRAIKIYDTELITTNLLTLPTLVTYQNNKKRPPSCFSVVVGLYCCFTLMVSMSQTSLFRRRK